ncbi:MAG TPA: hypothetical protein VFH58_05810 [Acidimicrobiales bacterium]|nr:hypothetical protein [Acidimicrobiales bacterium]
MKASTRVLLAAIVTEAALGLLGLVVGKQAHHSPHRPVARLVAAQFSYPATTIGIANVLSPGVSLTTQPKRAALATSVTRVTEPPRPSTSTTVAQRAIAVSARIQPQSQPASGVTATGGQVGWGCADAVAWLSTHSAPGYQFVCPGYAEGHQAMTCSNTAACPGIKLIVIAVPCPAAYMNEAHNSWIVSGLTSGVIDPFGYCS